MNKQKIYLIALFALGVVALVLYQAPTLKQPLIESYGFRQTQTAYQTQTIFTGEGTLLHPILPVFGAPWQVPFEFPIFQLSAALLMHVFGLQSDVASRTASLIWAILAIVPLWGVCRRYLTVTGSLVATAIFCASPLSLLYSRASLIEYCALFFCLGFAYLSLCLVEQQSAVLYLGAVLSASFAAMVKITTFIPALIFVLALLPIRTDLLPRFRSGYRAVLIAAGSPMLIGLVSGMWWTRHADSIKAASGATAWLTSSRLREWNLGTLDQRLHTENYRILTEDGIKLFGPLTFGALALCLPIVFLRVKYSRFLLASMLASATALLAFMNLYLVHEYYFVAVLPYVAIGTGILVQHLTAEVKNKQLQLIVAAVLIIGIIGSSLHFSKPWWDVSRKQFEYDRSIATVIPETSFVLVADRDWNPELLYAINRRGLMLRPGAFDIEYVRSLPDLSRYDFLIGPVQDTEYLQIRKFFSPVFPNVFKINERPASFESESLFATYELIPDSIASESVVLQCDESSTLELSRSTMQYGISVTASEEARVVFDSYQTSVPANRLFVHSAPMSAGDSLSCKDAEMISVQILRSMFLG
jgi:hypothetical protein